MAYRHQLTRNAGHPFTREVGWDLLEVKADSDAELSAYITAAAKKFWKVWIRDDTGARRVELYKPSNVAVEWDDQPGSTGLSKLLAGVDMRPSEHHIDLVLATFSHHVRSAVSLDDLVGRWTGALSAYGCSGKAVADVTAGLVGAVPALNDCLREAASPPEPLLWRENAHVLLSVAELAMAIEGPALPAAVSPQRAECRKKVGHRP